MAKNTTRETRGELTAPTAKNLVATIGNEFAGLKLGGGLEIVGTESVTRPVLQQEDNVAFAVMFERPIVKGEVFEGETRDGEAKQKAADIAFVINLTTGEEMVLICNAAMKSAIERAYPERVTGNGDWAYVGMSFAMIGKLKQHPNNKTKRIREYLIKRIITTAEGPRVDETIDTRRKEDLPHHGHADD
jgi:hypothetical protein